MLSETERNLIKNRQSEVVTRLRGNGSTDWKVYAIAYEEDVPVLLREIERLEGLINQPTIDDWFEGVRREAAYQLEQHGSTSDAGKGPPDWFWLLGWLAGKAVMAMAKGDTVTAKHHTISSAAVLLNWYRAISGDSPSLRPGRNVDKSA